MVSKNVERIPSKNIDVYGSSFIVEKNLWIGVLISLKGIKLSTWRRSTTAAHLKWIEQLIDWINAALRQTISSSTVWIYNDENDGKKRSARYNLFSLASVTRCEHRGFNQWRHCVYRIWFALKWAHCELSKGSAGDEGGRKCVCVRVLVKTAVMLLAIKASQHPSASFNQL